MQIYLLQIILSVDYTFSIRIKHYSNTKENQMPTSTTKFWKNAKDNHYAVIDTSRPYSDGSQRIIADCLTWKQAKENCEYFDPNGTWMEIINTQKEFWETETWETL